MAEGRGEPSCATIRKRMSATAPSEKTSSQTRVPSRRLVLLGASNVARGIASAVQAARSVFAGPFDLMAALGHGRSYGRGSWVLGRWLPGIVDCQLWEDLAQRETCRADGGSSAPTQAFITDVGNDILYGASPEQIADWVRTCVERLREHRCDIALSGIPLESLDRITSWEFPVFRTILYPGCFLTRQQALDRAAKLNDRLETLAADFELQFIAPHADWYGRDRIHITRGRQLDAWGRFLQGDETGETLTPSTWGEFLAIRRLIPHERRLFGLKQGREQPAGVLQDGTRVSLY